MDTEAVLMSVLALAGGEIVGRVRLQKMVYLLQHCCLKTEIPFRYHHYGPYSRSIDEAIDRAKARDILSERYQHRTGDGAEYSVFHFDGEVDSSLREREEKLRKTVEIMKSRSSTVLELAATIYWLAYAENRSDWSEELQVRKGQKVTPARQEQALRTLSDCGLHVS